MKNELLNHPRNFNVIFDEQDHRYYVNGELYQGVTSLVGNYFDAFDAEKVSKRVGFIKGVKPQDLRDEWDESNVYGKKIHKIIEDCVNLGVEDQENTFVTDTFLYTMEQYGIEPLVCEMTIYDETIRRASNVDIIGLKDGKLVVVDTKTMKKPIERTAYKGKRCFYPIGHLEQSKFNKHSLQVNFYRRWLKDKYGFNVADVNYIYSFNENSTEICQMIEVHNMDYEIDAIYTYLKTITPQ